jgi:hypothetical protein
MLLRDKMRLPLRLMKNRIFLRICDPSNLGPNATLFDCRSNRCQLLNTVRLHTANLERRKAAMKISKRWAKLTRMREFGKDHNCDYDTIILYCIQIFSIKQSPCRTGL